jgi:hypothetical protein
MIHTKTRVYLVHFCLKRRLNGFRLAGPIPTFCGSRNRVIYRFHVHFRFSACPQRAAEGAAEMEDIVVFPSYNPCKSHQSSSPCNNHCHRLGSKRRLRNPVKGPKPQETGSDSMGSGKWKNGSQSQSTRTASVRPINQDTENHQFPTSRRHLRLHLKLQFVVFRKARIIINSQGLETSGALDLYDGFRVLVFIRGRF